MVGRRNGVGPWHLACTAVNPAENLRKLLQKQVGDVRLRFERRCSSNHLGRRHERGSEPSSRKPVSLLRRDRRCAMVESLLESGRRRKAQTSAREGRRRLATAAHSPFAPAAASDDAEDAGRTADALRTRRASKFQGDFLQPGLPDSFTSMDDHTVSVSSTPRPEFLSASRALEDHLVHRSFTPY